jgi:hypothetical protein
MATDSRLDELVRFADEVALFCTDLGLPRAQCH